MNPPSRERRKQVDEEYVYDEDVFSEDFGDDDEPFVPRPVAAARAAPRKSTGKHNPLVFVTTSTRDGHDDALDTLQRRVQELTDENQEVRVFPPRILQRSLLKCCRYSLGKIK